MSKPYIDAYGVTRVAALTDLPDESVLCGWRGHGWPDTLPINPSPTGGWGALKVSEVMLTCPCGRRRRDVFADLDGEVLTRAYQGGTMLQTGAHVTRNEFRAEWGRRERSRKRRRGKAAVS